MVVSSGGGTAGRGTSRVRYPYKKVREGNMRGRRVPTTMNATEGAESRSGPAGSNGRRTEKPEHMDRWSLHYTFGKKPHQHTNEL